MAWLRNFTKAAVLLGASLGGASLENKVYAQDAVPNPTAVTTEESLGEKAVARLNEYRQKAGLRPVKFDPELSKDCEAHANYLRVNNLRPSLINNNLTLSERINTFHSEDPKLPGYTPEGKSAAGNVGFVDPISSIDGYIGTFFHRLPLLDPYITNTGTGAVKNDKDQWFTVTSSGKVNWDRHLQDFVVYPTKNQNNVPLAMASEDPNPIPNDADGVGGYPITISWYGPAFDPTAPPSSRRKWSVVTPKNLEGSLKKFVPAHRAEVVVRNPPGSKDTKLRTKYVDVPESWVDVPFHFASPEKPVPGPFGRAAYIIAKDPLENATTYEFSFRGTYPGETPKPFEYKSSFTTVDTAQGK
ncbi:MAG TPA: CAP domain-containing protein [Candidatus Nanoarchaeia archaeon]|nr:CAP domain-containing protein [Candidatus Nanoarchaeia archaeon]